MNGDIHFLLSSWLSPSCPFAKSDLCKGNQQSSHFKEPPPPSPLKPCREELGNTSWEVHWVLGFSIVGPWFKTVGICFLMQECQAGTQELDEGGWACQVADSQHLLPSSLPIKSPAASSEHTQAGEGTKHAFSFSLEWLKEFSSGKRNLKDWFLWVWDKLTLLKWASSRERKCIAVSPPLRGS